MCANVLSCDVGAEALEPERVVIEHETALFLVVRVAERPRSQEKAQLQRHVEARKICLLVQLDTRDIVNSVRTFADDANDFLYANFARVLDFQRRTCAEATVLDGEQKSAQEWAILSVERTVDENVLLVHQRVLDVDFAGVEPRRCGSDLLASSPSFWPSIFSEMCTATN